MKQLLLLLFSSSFLLAMHNNKERQFSIEGRRIIVRHNVQQQFIFAKFAEECPVRNTYVSKDLRTNKYFPRTRYVYYSESQKRDIFLPDELNEEQAALLKKAIKHYVRTASEEQEKKMVVD